MKPPAAAAVFLCSLVGLLPGPDGNTDTPPPPELARPAPADRETVWSAWIAQEYDGQPEARTLDGSRVDVLTDSTAWEVEWCDKWKEAPGQAVFYGVMKDRRPGVVLLLKGEPHDERNALRCAIVCAQTGVRLRFIDTRTGLRK